MLVRGVVVAIALAGLGCGARAQTVAAADRGDDIRMYLDRTLVERRIVIVATSAGRTTVPLHVAADVRAADVVVMDLGGLTGSQIRPVQGTRVGAAVPPTLAPSATSSSSDAGLGSAAPDEAAPGGPIARPDDPLDDPLDNPDLRDDPSPLTIDIYDADGNLVSGSDDDDPDDDDDDGEHKAERDPSRGASRDATAGSARKLDATSWITTQPAQPSELELVVDAPRAGQFVVWLGYATQLVRWDAAYTITTGPARDLGTVRGMLTIQNRSGVALRGAAHVVDAELGTWQERWSERLRAALGAAPAPSVNVRALGTVVIAQGETRLELFPAARPRALRTVLVYDATGPTHDHTGAAPVGDPELGRRARTAKVFESLELARDADADRGLPAGMGTLIERRADGTQATLGTSRLFDGAPGVVRAETVQIGAAKGLAGRREQRDWARDDEQRRYSEEFLVTIRSTRPQPVEVVVREHLYRGQNWTLAYQSGPASKEGAQQIALRAVVPANGEAKVLYVVVYTW